MQASRARGDVASPVTFGGDALVGSTARGGRDRAEEEEVTVRESPDLDPKPEPEPELEIAPGSG